MVQIDPESPDAGSDELDLTPRNIDVHVRAIRHKLGSQRDLIQTVRSVGYRFRD